MAIDETKRFTFVSQGMPEDTFAVVEFSGTEGISRLYEFGITLASDDGEIDLKGVLQNPATLTIKGGDQDLPIHGAVAEFKQLNEVKGHYFYRALLVPRLRQANLYHENQLFLDKKVPDIIEEILKQAGLTTQDYELKLTRSYPQWEYICQYRETDFDFVSRWMEREGIYYYFEQGEQNEKIIITDNSTAHKDIPGDAQIPYFTASGLAPEEEAIKALVCTQKMLPKKVILKDYNYRKPSLELKAEAEVDSKGRGDVYLYGEHFKDPGQGNELAKIRAEEIKCRENIFHGEGTAPNLCPGFFFTLDGHYRDSYNQKYLILEVEHEGHQTGAFWSGVGEEPAEGEEKLTYANRFTAIPSDVQFRPERTTPKSKFFGTMNATVDAAGDGQHAETDDQGRYKIILPFDQSGNKDGKASRWVRMAQPYSGFNASDGIKGPSGMHFPLHKGTEVLLTFVDGDPDRPIIAGSIPNPQTISPVTQENQTRSVIRDNYGNEIVMDATPGDEHIRLYSPHHKSGIVLGRSADVWTESDDNSVKLGNQAEFALGMKTEATLGAVTEFKAGLITEGMLGTKLEFGFGGTHKFEYMWDKTYSDGPIIHSTNMDILSLSKKDQVLGAGDGVGIVGGAGGDGNSRSIVNLKPEYLTLTVGPKEVQTIVEQNPETYSNQIFGDYLPPEKFEWKTAAGAYIALAMALSGGVLGVLAGKEDENLRLGANIFSLVIGSIALVGSPIYAFWEAYKEYKEREKRIEPVKHVHPAAILKMKDDGKVIVGANKVPEGEQQKGEIKLGIGANGAETAELQLQNEMFRMRAGKAGKQSFIGVAPESGNVQISSLCGSTGKTSILSKDKILLFSHKDIILSAKGYNVSIEGNIKSRNLQVSER